MGGVSQLIYGMKALSLLNFKAFKETDSLDNNLLFGEGEVIENSGFHIFLAVIASFVALVVLLLSALNFQRLFDLNFYSNADVMRSIFYWSNVIGAAPALIFNLRTWNLRVIRN